MNRPSEEAADAGSVRAPDWLKALVLASEESGDEFDLTTLQAGDMLRVTTLHTVYTLRVVDPVTRDVILSTDRADRPAGPARLMGCTFGLSSTIKPDHLFCGGNLEFTHDEGERIHTTTAIEKVEWLRVDGADETGPGTHPAKETTE